jgi:hypothetical protein
MTTLLGNAPQHILGGEDGSPHLFQLKEIK